MNRETTAKWNRARFRRLACALGFTEEYLAVTIGLEPTQMRKAFRENKFMTTHALHLDNWEKVAEQRFGVFNQEPNSQDMALRALRTPAGKAS